MAPLYGTSPFNEKPEPEIYQNFKKYRLTAEETVFIDDLPENIDAVNIGNGGNRI